MDVKSSLLSVNKKWVWHSNLSLFWYTGNRFSMAFVCSQKRAQRSMCMCLHWTKCSILSTKNCEKEKPKIQWKRGGLMVSVLDSGSGGLGLSPGQGHCVVFLGWGHFTLTVLLFTQVYRRVPANVLAVTLRWTSIPSRGEWQYSWPLHAKKTGVKHWPHGPLGPV